MFFKDKKIVALLLLIIIVVFSILATNNNTIFNNFIENFDDDDVPSCPDSGVPGCYSTVMDVDYSDYNPNFVTPDSNYILKTSMIPPICPACPSVINNHGHDGNYSDYSNNDINSNNNYQSIINEENTNVESTNVEQNASNVEQNVTQTNTYNYGNNSNNNNNSQQNSSLFGNNSSSSGGLNSNEIKQYQKQIQDLQGEISKLKQSGGNCGSKNETCPPCPACERCPEPAFTCEKVINYRSPNVGNYLPLPVLNDFSNIPNN